MGGNRAFLCSAVRNPTTRLSPEPSQIKFKVADEGKFSSFQTATANAFTLNDALFMLGGRDTLKSNHI